VRSVLESRLRIPIDKRIISIAQLAPESSGPEPAVDGAGERRTEGDVRYRLLGLETEVSGQRVSVRLRLQFDGEEAIGTATEVEAGDGRARAAALAALDAINGICGDRARFGLDFATSVEAVGYEYALVSVAVTSPRLGRRAVRLHGANRVEQEDSDSAAVLAVLKATNRVLAFVVGPADQRTRKRPRSR